MKIVTWNLKRPVKSNPLILAKLAQFDADIVVLTETSTFINLESSNFLAASEILKKGDDGMNYALGENRTSVWSKYPIAATHETCDDFTSVCIDLETHSGCLALYATIIGIFGGIGNRFKTDLQNQISDFEKLCSEKPFFIAGDFNVSFSG